jgi:predicted Zn-dependent peptidase
MKIKFHFILFIVFLTFIGFLYFFKKENTLKNPRELTFPQVKCKFKKSERIVLGNGMIVYFLEDHELPIINVTALFRTGTIYDPKEKSGLTKISGKVMRTGGTKSRSSKEINDILEFLPASVEINVSQEYFTANLSCHKKDFLKVLAIYADILIDPLFPEDKITLAKDQSKEGIRRQNDNPDKIAFREFKKIIYKHNTRGIIPTLHSIDNIKREDLINFHSKYIKPNNIILGVSGDIYKHEMIKNLKKYFVIWEKSTLNIPSIPPPKNLLSKRNFYYIEKDAPQSIILSGNITTGKKHTSYYSFQVLNQIIGGEFNSRLNSEIRSNRGLAYSVGSYYKAAVDYGVFGIYCFTKNESTLKTTELIFDILEKIKKDGITQKELNLAKDSIINSFIFSVSSAKQIVGNQMFLEYNGINENFYDNYIKNIQDLTKDMVNKATKSFILIDKDVVLILGDEKKFDMPISKIGEIEKISLRSK